MGSEGVTGELILFTVHLDSGTRDQDRGTRGRAVFGQERGVGTGSGGGQGHGRLSNSQGPGMM